ncbi:MAG: hypothetical protein ACHQ51_04310 [Elusimicrobiota bacterium]
MSIRLNSAGDTPGLQPFVPLTLASNIAGKGDLVFGKDLLPIEEPYLRPDAVVKSLQDALAIDLGLDARQRLCRYGPVQFKLLPTLTLYKWAASPFGYSADLSLYADRGNGSATATRACKYGSRIKLGIDPVSGEYVVRDYVDGLAQMQFAAGGSPTAKKDGRKKDGAALLYDSFQSFDFLFGDEGPTMLSESSDTDAKGFTIPNRVNGWLESARALTQRMSDRRLAAVREAVRLSPKLAMGHAALGLLLSEDCQREKPNHQGFCEEGIRSLLKARELAPHLAFPAYVLASRARQPAFPEKLRPLLKENAAALCGAAQESAPAWDWAYFSACGFRGDRWGKKEPEEGNASSVKSIPIIRPVDILRGYLNLELQKP